MTKHTNPTTEKPAKEKPKLSFAEEHFLVVIEGDKRYSCFHSVLPNESHADKLKRVMPFYLFAFKRLGMKQAAELAAKYLEEQRKEYEAKQIEHLGSRQT